MRGFLYVSGLLAGGIVLAFVIALLGAEEPIDRLPPQLIEGAELTGAEAQQAYAGWLSALPREPATPLRLLVELKGSGAAPGNPAAAGFELSLDLALQDARRGRTGIKLSIQEPGKPVMRAEGVLLADGETMWLWGETEGMDIGNLRKGAVSVKQSLVEEAWASLRPRFPELLRLAGVAGMSQTITPPNSLLMLIHPLWMSGSLASWNCSSLRLEGEVLRGSFQPGGELAGLDLRASFNVNSGLAREITATGPLTGAGDEGSLSVAVTPLDSDIPAALLAPPKDLNATDVSPMAQMGIAAMNAALAALGGESDTEF